MQNIRSVTTHFLFVGLIIFAAFTTYAQTSISDPIFYYYSDAELYQNGYQAYQDNDFTAAALYLYAYAQRHEDILNGSGSQEKAEFYRALVYTTRHLHAVDHQKADDPYGREYLPLAKSYFDNKPALPKSIPLAEEPPQKQVKFRVFVRQEPGGPALTEEPVIVRYDVALHESGKAFQVKDIHTQFTGNGGKKPAEFTILPGEMAYFEAYKSMAELKAVIKEKRSQKWTVQPLKNFGNDSTRLCKTDSYDINKQQKNACYSSLTLGLISTGTATTPDKADEPQPVALFTTDRTACFPPCTVTCTNRSENADRYEWSLNGKLVSRERNFICNLQKAEGHRIKLTAYRGDKFDVYEVSVRGYGE